MKTPGTDAPMWESITWLVGLFRVPDWAAVLAAILLAVVIAVVAWRQLWYSKCSRHTSWVITAALLAVHTVWGGIAWVSFEGTGSHGDAAPCTDKGCTDMLSCQGLQDWTLNLRYAFTVFGGTFAIITLLRGALVYQTGAMETFYGLMVSYALVYAVVLVSDTIFIEVCQAYPYSTMAFMTSFIGDFPLHYTTKYTVRSLSKFPMTSIDLMLEMDVAVTYIVCMTLVTSFLAGTAYQAKKQIHMFDFGPAMLGPNFDMQTWGAHSKAEQADAAAAPVKQIRFSA
mmetsp:Transcript_18364/g.44243  ORF Transcript_18364/g.44243 Transcript_18364/m.44243 type:complete len:284 (+) Transcript_18364:84-935(+)